MKPVLGRILTMLVLVGIGFILGLAMTKFQRLEKPQMIIGTHDGTPHADDIFAVAILLLVDSRFDVIRTRDKQLLQTADIRVDVGMKYEPPTDFDHHMADFNATRPDGRPYASAGLVGSHFWPQLIERKQVYERLDDKLLSSIDAMDCGINIYTPISPYRVFDIQSYFAGYIPSAAALTGKTKPEIDAILYKSFMECVDEAKRILTREIDKARYWVADQELITHAIETSKHVDPRFIVLRRYAAWGETVAQHPEILFVVFYDESSENWVLQTVPEIGNRFSSKKPLPLEWAGKAGPEFVRITGIHDAVFCHRSRFQARAKSKESILEMVDRVLD